MVDVARIEEHASAMHLCTLFVNDRKVGREEGDGEEE